MHYTDYFWKVFRNAAREFFELVIIFCVFLSVGVIQVCLPISRGYTGVVTPCARSQEPVSS